MLTRRGAPFNFYDPRRPIYTHPRFLPGSRVSDCTLRDVIIAEGCYVDRCRVEESVVGIRTTIQPGADIRRSVLLGADFYEADDDAPARGDGPRLGIGRDVVLDRVIVDKNARIGDGARLVNEAGVQDADGDGYFIRDGVIIVPKDGVIHRGGGQLDDDWRGWRRFWSQRDDPIAAVAQTDPGRISGTVRDSSERIRGRATVTVKNEAPGEARTAMTNAQGFFLIAPLRPSTYTIKAEKPGFAAIEYTAMPVAVGQELALDFEFKPAGVQESVTVVGTAPILDISSARIGVNVSEREVQGLPVNGRQMSQLMLQAPGSQNAGDGTWQDIRFSGRANEQNVIKYDGVEGSAIIDASPGNVNGENNTPFKLQASLENVQEFRVESSSYPAGVRHRHRRPGERHHQVGQQHASTARSSSTCAATSSTRGIISTRCAPTTTASSRRDRSRR